MRGVTNGRKWVGSVATLVALAGGFIVAAMPAGAQNDVIEVTISARGATPAELTVASGVTVRWRNTGSEPASLQANNGAFSFPSIPPGASVERRFSGDDGQVDYRVTVGAEAFVGSITVAAGSGETVPAGSPATTPAPPPGATATTLAPAPSSLAGTGISPRFALVFGALALMLCGAFALFASPAGRHAQPVRIIWRHRQR